jgi:hypothetical protein
MNLPLSRLEKEELTSLNDNNYFFKKYLFTKRKCDKTLVSFPVKNKN